MSVHRIWTSRFGAPTSSAAPSTMSSSYLSAAWRLWRLAASGDVVVAKTDPPMLSVVAAPICWLRGACLVNWLQDIFPETAQALAVGGRAASVAYATLRRLRDASLKSAHMNVVLGERMAQHVRELGVSPQHIRIIANWADGTTITRSIAPRMLCAQNGASAARSLSAIPAILAASTRSRPSSTPQRSLRAPTARQAKHRHRLCGSSSAGALFERLKNEVRRRKLALVRFEPYQPREALSQSLSAADVHLVCLRPALEGLIVPSKVYGICAAAATIFVGARSGEIAQLIGRCGCGEAVAMGNGAGLAQTIARLAADPAACRQMGQRARQAFDAEFDKSIAVARWEELLHDVATGVAEAGRSRELIRPRL